MEHNSLKFGGALVSFNKALAYNILDTNNQTDLHSAFLLRR